MKHRVGGLGLKKSTILSYSHTSDLLKQCGFAHPAEIPRGSPDVDSDPKGKSADRTNDVLTNSAVFARLVPCARSCCPP
jgi:hypothetical protein